MKWLKQCAWAVLIFLWGPLLFVLFKGLSPDAMAALFSKEEILRAFANSLMLALVSAALAVVGGALTAAVLPSMPRLTKRVMQSGLIFPMLLPEISFALALRVWCINLEIPLGWSSMALGHFAYLFPFAAIILKGHFESLDRSQIDAVKDLGGSGFTVLRHGIIPQIMPGLLAAFATCFLLSLDDFFVSYFAKNVDEMTLPIKIYAMLRMSVGPEIYALSLILFTLSLVAVLFSQLWWQKRNAKV